MRRENRKQNKVNSNTTVFVTGGILLLAIATFVITFIVYSNKLDNDLYSFDSEYLAQYTDMENNNVNTEKEKETASASSSIGKTVQESKNTISNEKANTTVNNVTSTVTNTTVKQKTKNETTSTNNKNKVQKDPSFVKPIEGEVLKEYAKDSLVYSETLKEWTTHLGIDIKAERATVVKSAADGTVKYIKNDPRFGLTIIIEHSNGFETRYCNLLTTEFVSEGEEVKRGQTIGTVGDSAVYEIVDENHLHFEMLKNNESVNPGEYIKF